MHRGVCAPALLPFRQVPASSSFSSPAGSVAQAFLCALKMRPGHPAALQPLPPQYEAGGASLPSLDLSSNLETANRSWSVYQKEGLRTELSLDELLPIAWCVLTFALFGVVYLGAFLWSRRKHYDAHGSGRRRL